MAGIVVCCVVLLGVRFVVFPELERNRDAVTQLLASQIGQPVEIDKLATGWDGWDPRLNIAGLRVLERAGGPPVLTLPEVRLVVAWTSLLFLDLRLKELAIDRPQLAVRRDASGMFHVAGVAIDLAENQDGRLPAEWLLRQRRIVVHDASIVWRDEQRNAPQLLLQHVEFRIESRFGRHRFGLTGVPPPELAAPVDLRGDLTWSSLGDWRASTGRFYARLDYADVGAWREWLPLPVALRSGKGALRVWFDYAHGEVSNIVADLVLADVQTKLAAELPELSLARVDGRVGWRDDGTRRELFTQRLTFIDAQGAALAPTDLKLVLMRGPTGTLSSGSIEFNNLQLAPLRLLAGYLPLPERWRDEVARFAPQGTLEQGNLRWEGETSSPTAFAASARFVNVGWKSHERLPGVRELTGSLEATHRGGAIKLQSHMLTLDLPRVFLEPLAFDTAQGQIKWRRDKDSVVVTIEQLTFANAHAAGSASGTYRTAVDGPGTIDGVAQLSRADSRYAHYYLPSVVGPATQSWLNHSLVAGTSNDVRIKLSGNLADFPFADGKKGEFLVAIKAQAVTLDYAEHWPPLTEGDAEVRFEGARLSVDAKRAQIFGVALNRLRAEVPDLRVANPMLRIDGEATGATADFLRLVVQSPVTQWINHFADGVEASGTGKLSVKLELPLGNPEANTVAGEYIFNANRVKLPAGIPTVHQLSGKLAFSEHEVRAALLTGDILGGPARITIATTGGAVRVNGQGTANLSLLRAEYPEQPLAARLSGITDWQMTVNVTPELSAWVIDTNLKGASVDLPAPASKAAADAVPLKIERRSGEPNRDTIAITYERLGRLLVDRRLTATTATPERALLTLGSARGEPERRGLWVRGDVDTVNVDGWLAVKAQLDASGASGELPLSGVDLRVGKLDAFGRRFNDLRIGAGRDADSWQLDLHGRELAGSARWQGPGPGHPNGRVVARLQRLTTPAPTPVAPVAVAVPNNPDTPTAASAWPAIDIIADSFQLKEHELGKLELTAQPRGADWQIQNLKLNNSDGELTAEGWWRGVGRTQQTKLDAQLDLVDAGKYLARFGFPDAVRGAPTKIRGQLAWAGGPQEFDYPTLSGSFRLETGQGQFTRLDPGLGKLLGVLSLQSLRRRLTFDFRDIFGEGFAFDEIAGEVRIQNGVMKSDNLKIIGPSARVAISGEADIARETQQLHVRVQPTLSAGVSVGAAALLLANPVVGVAVGAGSLFAQKALQDPIEKIFAHEYAVTGSWSDPVVSKPSAPAAASSALEGPQK